MTNTSLANILFHAYICENCQMSHKLDDTCYYCDDEAMFTEYIVGNVIGVCKRHFVQEVSS